MIRINLIFIISWFWKKVCIKFVVLTLTYLIMLLNLHFNKWIVCKSLSHSTEGLGIYILNREQEPSLKLLTKGRTRREGPTLWAAQHQVHHFCFELSLSVGHYSTGVPLLYTQKKVLGVSETDDVFHIGQTGVCMYRRHEEFMSRQMACSTCCNWTTRHNKLYSCTPQEWY